MRVILRSPSTHLSSYFMQCTYTYVWLCACVLCMFAAWLGWMVFYAILIVVIFFLHLTHALLLILHSFCIISSFCSFTLSSTWVTVIKWKCTKPTFTHTRTTTIWSRWSTALVAYFRSALHPLIRDTYMYTQTHLYFFCRHDVYFFYIWIIIEIVKLSSGIIIIFFSSFSCLCVCLYVCAYAI